MVTVTRLRLQEAQSVAQLLADAMFQRVFDVTNAGPRIRTRPSSRTTG